ncbi:MAG: type II toxin-antitoxin system VapC family toxin [Candidatus Solibacter usitatus]|nr:type II toxin-antitoxin system VapC family toxin [Candidatus Solibacter usitatus]
MGPFLLDTSTLIWTMAAPERLSRKARTAVRSGTPVVSVISYWEVMVKCKKGLLSVGDPLNWWQVATESLAAEVLSIRATHVAALRDLPDVHRDPFDRMLIAQAISEGLTLLTSDSSIRRYPVATCW